jgi:TonB family protein
MMRILIAPLAFLLLVSGVEQRATAGDVRLLVPSFEASDNLGVNVATVVGLEIGKSLRKVPAPNPRNLQFSQAEIGFEPVPLSEQTAERAAAVGVERRHQLVLWGSVFRYGSAYVVQTQLSIPDVSSFHAHFGKWSVNLQKFLLMELGLPDTDYVFSSIPLTSEAVTFLSRRTPTMVCAEKQASCSGRQSLKRAIRLVRQEGDYALVQQGGSTDESQGWVYLPQLLTDGSAAVTFTSAMMRYTAGDFERAAKLFLDAYDADRNELVRFQSLVMAGISTTRDGGDGGPHLRTALKVNPYSRYAVQALVMSNLSVSDRKHTSDSRRAFLISEAERTLEAYRHLFEGGDPWLLAADWGIEEGNRKLEQVSTVSVGSNQSALPPIYGATFKFVDMTNVARYEEMGLTTVGSKKEARVVIREVDRTSSWRNRVLSQLEGQVIPKKIERAAGSAEISVVVGQDGRILAAHITRSSNDPSFDSVLLNLVRTTQRLPAPPPGVADPVIVVGMRP